jgi:hypothetical protein
VSDVYKTPRELLAAETIRDLERVRDVCAKTAQELTPIVGNDLTALSDEHLTSFAQGVKALTEAAFTMQLAGIVLPAMLRLQKDSKL